MDYEAYLDPGKGNFSKILEKYPELVDRTRTWTAFEEFCDQHNRGDRDIGELDDLAMFELERLVQEYKKHSRAAVSAPSQFSRDLAQMLGEAAQYGVERWVADKILDRIGETKPPKYLGEGNFAKAYWLKSQRNKVLKITQDWNDAKALQRVKDKPQKHLVKVYDVFNIVPMDLWGAVVEKLQPLSSAQYMRWEHWIDVVEEELPKPLKRFLLHEGLSDSWVDLLDEWLAQNPDTYLDDETLDQLRIWGKELTKLQIQTGDIHPNNIMEQGRRLLLTDLGYGKVPSTSIPKL
jgi:hypothetical protein